MTATAITPSTPTLRWLRRIILIGTAVYWLGLFALTHTPVTLPAIVVSHDKTGHFIGYAILGAALYMTLRVAGWRDATLGVLVIGLAYGAIDEWLQIPVGRSCELNDWFADAAGTACAAAVGGLVTRWREQRAARASW